jgi:flagellar biosynthesis/type III secretory pathway chaperone
MTTPAQLIAILEDEVQLGETLLHNLAAQKEAILAWNSSKLLIHVEEKEHLVRKLAEMEEKRQTAVRQLLRAHGVQDADETPSLKILLTQFPPTPHTAALEHLQQRAWKIYSQLRAEEKQLTSLMSILLNHISEALGSLTPPARMTLYGEKGIVAAARPDPGFVQEKV